MIVRTLEATPKGATHWSTRDGRRERAEPDRGLADLAGVRAQAAPGRHLQAVQGPAVRREGPRRRRAVPRSARARGGAVRRREDQIQALDRTPPVAADAARQARAPHPRLQAPRRHRAVRRAQHGHRPGHRLDCTAATGRRVQQVPRASIDTRGPRRARRCTCRSTTPPPTRPPRSSDWLLAHPRFTFHFTPTSRPGSTSSSAGSPNSPTRWLRRGTHSSVTELERRPPRLDRPPGTTNPSPSSGHKTADQILDSLAKYLPTGSTTRDTSPRRTSAAASRGGVERQRATRVDDRRVGLTPRCLTNVNYSCLAVAGPSGAG